MSHQLWMLINDKSINKLSCFAFNEYICLRTKTVEERIAVSMLLKLFNNGNKGCHTINLHNEYAKIYF